MRTHWCKRGAKYLFIVVYVLVFAEVYARVAMRDVRIGPSFTMTDAEHAWVIRKDFTGRRVTREYDMTFTTGAQGFRGGTYSPEKPAGVMRIASLGNSQAFGVGVNDDETYAHLTDKLLSERLGRRVEVINMAVTDSGTGHILSMWDEIMRFQPDMLLVRYDDWNFNQPNLLWRERDGRLVKVPQAGASRFRMTMERSGVLRLLERTAVYGFTRLYIFRYAARFRETGQRMFTLRRDPAASPEAQLERQNRLDALECRLVRELIDRARRHQVPLVFLKFKLKPQRDAAFDQLSNVPGVYVLDLRDMLDRPEFFYPIDEHLTPRGHVHIAERLTAFLQERFDHAWHTLAEPAGVDRATAAAP